jgi:hypothetical protein
MGRVIADLVRQHIRIVDRAGGDLGVPHGEIEMSAAPRIHADASRAAKRRKTMLNKTKLTVAAALVLASASAVMAAGEQSNRDQLSSIGATYRHHRHVDGNVGYAERGRYYDYAPQSAPFQTDTWFDRATSNVNHE